MGSLWTRRRLLEQIQAEQTQLLAAIDPALQSDPGVEGYWSVKDILAHLSFWLQLIADELSEVAQGRTPTAIPDTEIQPLNERVYQQHRAQPASAIQAQLRHSLQALQAAVQGLEEHWLQAPCSWTDEGTLGQHIANELSHCQEHRQVIEQWWAQRQGQPH